MVQKSLLTGGDLAVRAAVPTAVELPPPPEVYNTPVLVGHVCVPLHARLLVHRPF